MNYWKDRKEYEEWISYKLRIRYSIHRIDMTIDCECGKPMKIRMNRVGSDLFWGCSSYPECSKTLNAKDGAEHLIQRNILTQSPTLNVGSRDEISSYIRSLLNA